MNYIRSSGFWIINCNAALRSNILKCVTCRHLEEASCSKRWHLSQVIGCVRNLLLHIGCRENIRLLRSDNGSNFVGVPSEIKKAFAEMDQQKINDFMRDSVGEWMLWKRNPPSASNMGRVWER